MTFPGLSQIHFNKKEGWGEEPFLVAAGHLPCYVSLLKNYRYFVSSISLERGTVTAFLLSESYKKVCMTQSISLHLLETLPRPPLVRLHGGLQQLCSF